MKPTLIIYWSRRDFRLHDNPALHQAIQESKKDLVPLLPLYIMEDYMRESDFGYPSRMFLSKAIPTFAAHFHDFTVVQGKAFHYFKTLAKQYTLHIHVNEDIHPLFFLQVKKIIAAGIAITVHCDRLTIDKNTTTGTGNTYSVFTPFKKAVWHSFIASTCTPRSSPNDAIMLPETIKNTLPYTVACDTETIQSLFATARTMVIAKTTINLDEHISLPDSTNWYTNETEALSLCGNFITTGKILHYKENRDSLEKDTENNGQTSHLSLGLAWGLISARTIIAMIRKEYDELLTENENVESYISELIWREFYGYLLWHNPSLLTTEFQKKFRNTITWSDKTTTNHRFIAWIEGKTGYPIVDAAMHQLAQTGWMHNRARMIVASVLTKNFGVDWRLGQAYFQATLIDLDEASNNGGWQWGASVGADPKPIRIFNPTLQAKTHDANAAYQNKWLPALYFIGGPATNPIIEHSEARNMALNRYGLSQDGSSVRDY